eukprot:12833018-Alexandrium_andersonii.AAC.1
MLVALAVDPRGLDALGDGNGRESGEPAPEIQDDAALRAGRPADGSRSGGLGREAQQKVRVAEPAP